MDIGQTQRGFAIGHFTDHYGIPCSIQKSSIADVSCIWFGADEIGLKRFEPGGGWTDIELVNVPLGVTHQANTRMHLTQEQVKELLPVLTHFAETGELPD